MNTPFDAWLAELRRAKKGGMILPAVTRGRALTVPMLIRGDFSEASWRGQVRIHPDSAALEASFTFSAGVYDAEYDQTEMSFSLPAGTGANSTGNMTLPTDGSTIAVFAFDILCTPDGGSENLFLGGALPVIGRVAV